MQQILVANILPYSSTSQRRLVPPLHYLIISLCKNCSQSAVHDWRYVKEWSEDRHVYKSQLGSFCLSMIETAGVK